MADAKSKGQILKKQPSKTETDKQAVLQHVKELMPEWDNERVEVICTEHNFDADKIQQALNEEFEGENWQVNQKKQPKPKKAATTPKPEGSAPRESPKIRSPRDNRDNRGDRSDRSDRGENRGRSDRGGREGRGGRGGQRGSGRGGAGGRRTDNRTATTTTSTTATTTVTSPTAQTTNFEPAAEPWGGSTTTQVETSTPATTEWGSSPTASQVPAPSPFTRPQASEESGVRQRTWAERLGGERKQAAKIAAELKSQEAFPPQQRSFGADSAEIPADLQGLVPPIIHVQPVSSTLNYAQSVGGGAKRWGKKPEPAAPVEPAQESSMTLLVEQTSSLTITSFQADPQFNTSAPTIQAQTSSPLVIAVSQATSEPQASFATPEFQQQEFQQTFQLYQPTSQAQAPSADKTSQNFAQNQNVSQNQDAFVSDHRLPDGKLVLDLLSAANGAVILPPQTPTVPISAEFVTFGNFQQPVSAQFSPKAQPEQAPPPAAEPKPVAQQAPVEQPPQQQDVQPQHSQQPFASAQRESSASAKPSTPDSSNFSSASAPSPLQTQGQQYGNYAQQQQQQPQQPQQPQQQQQQQQQPLVPPPSQGGYRAQGPSHVYESYYPPGPYYPSDGHAYYDAYGAREGQGYHNGGFEFGYPARGGRRGGNTQQFYPPPNANRGSLLSNGAESSGAGSPPSGEPVSPNSKANFAKSSNFPSSKAGFPNNNNGKISPQMPYNKPPATTTSTFKPPLTPTQPGKSFKLQPAPQQTPLHHQEHFVTPYPGMYGGFPYFSYPTSQPPGYMHPASMYGFDPRSAGYYPYGAPATAQPFDEFGEYNKQSGHYPDSSAQRGAAGTGEWAGSSDVAKAGSTANTPSAGAAGMPNSMGSNKGSVTSGGAAKMKPQRYDGYETDPHFNYPFAGAPPTAGSPQMAMHASAAPYQPPNYPLQPGYTGHYDHARYGNGPNWQ